MADEKQGYVLADRGTWLSYRSKLDLEVLVEGDPALHNPYGAILVNPARHEGLNVEGARALLDYLTSPAGQKRIGGFRAHGEVLFHPSASE
jgi:tungstate transport system substrate-binding protein